LKNEEEIPAEDTEVVEENTKTSETETSEPEKSGQDESQYKDFDTFISEKGWKKEEATDQLLKSYQDLESKLGNWKEVEQRAKEYEELKTAYEQAQEKAAAWDRAQAYLNNLEMAGKLQKGQVDLSKLPTQQLAQLWQTGRIGISDLPKERQFEVQRFVQNQELAMDRQMEDTAKKLAEKFPILKNPQWAEIAATQIERGMRNPKTGKELTPEEIIAQIDKEIKQAEKRGEERIKKDTEELKKGNLERPGSAVRTTPNRKIKSVYDAFKAAKSEIEEGR